MKYFGPKDSPYFGTLEKIATVTPENGQLIFGDPEFGPNAQILEFSVDSLFAEPEPESSEPLPIRYRVTKKSGSFYELDTLEDAERVAARESDTDESLEIVEFGYRSSIINDYGQLKVSLPSGIHSVDIFQVVSVIPMTYGVFGYFVQFAEPDLSKSPCNEQEIEGFSLGLKTILIYDAAVEPDVTLYKDRWRFNGKPIELFGDDGYGSLYASAGILDDGDARGICVATASGGAYHFGAVHQGDGEETSLLGILMVISIAGPHEVSEEDLFWSPDEVATISWNDGSYTGELSDGVPEGEGIFVQPDGLKYVGSWEMGTEYGHGTLTYPDGAVYVGEFQNGLRQGRGRLVDPDGDVYIGEWRGDYMAGQGTMTFVAGGMYEHGAAYEGEWYYDEMEEFGVMTWGDGAKYEGHWRKGQRHGRGTRRHGTMTYPDGSQYVGEWSEDSWDGNGTVTFVGGNKYVGKFKDYLFDGEGTYTWADGAIYEGRYKEDKRHGRGTMIYPDGAKYVGSWRRGKYQGTGTWTNPDGDKYEGRWKDGKVSGKGVRTWDDGATYDGQWKDDQRYGEGIMTHPDGSSYVGAWRDDEIVQGTATYDDGSQFVGEFQDGIAWNGDYTLYDEDGNLIEKETFVDGELTE